jgi:C4-dicarboxylate-specific signal transduction histidine kinase
MTIDRSVGNHRRWGVAQQLIVLVLVALLPFVILEVVRGIQDVTQRRQTITARALGQVEEEAETMEDYLRFTDRYLSTLAADPALRRLDQPAMAELFEVVRQVNPNYINVFFVTPAGEQIASTSPEVSDPRITEQPYFRDALAGGRVAISPALAYQDTGRSAMVFARRVLGADGEPVGVLGIALNLARLNTVIGFVSLPEGSVVLLMQRDGTVIAASEEPERWVGRSGVSKRRGRRAASARRWRCRMASTASPGSSRSAARRG